MPTIRVTRRKNSEVSMPEELLVYDALFWRLGHLSLKWRNVSHGSASSTRYFRRNPREAMEESTSGFCFPRMARLGIRDQRGGPLGGDLTYRLQFAITHDEADCVAFSKILPEPPYRRQISDLSPLVRNQIEEITTGVNAKLRKRLGRFESDYEGKERVSGATSYDVKQLVRWLCTQSDTVSATVSNDGMLSVATVFPNDVRLYIEIERDGSVDAALTRERRYARDLSVDTVADITSEEILAAVTRISSL